MDLRAAGLLLATEPVWVMILGKVFLAERAGARAWLGSAAALGGVAVLAVLAVLAGPAALTGAGGPRALEDIAPARPSLNHPGHRPARCLAGGAVPPGAA